VRCSTRNGCWRQATVSYRSICTQSHYYYKFILIYATLVYNACLQHGLPSNFTQPPFETYSQGQLDQVVADYAAAKAKHDAAKTTNGPLLSNIQFAAILSYISHLEPVEYEARYDNGEFSIKII